MPLPTMSLRVAPEHHQLLRDIATALRTRPQLADVLRDVLQAQHDGVTVRDTDVLQPILERLAITEEFTRRIMAFAESINDRLKTLEQAAPQAAAPQPPRPATPGKRRPPTPITDDMRRWVHDMRNAGQTRDAIAQALQIGGATVSRILSEPARG